MGVVSHETAEKVNLQKKHMRDARRETFKRTMLTKPMTTKNEPINAPKYLGACSVYNGNRGDTLLADHELTSEHNSLNRC